MCVPQLKTSLSKRSRPYVDHRAHLPRKLLPASACAQTRFTKVHSNRVSGEKHAHFPYPQAQRTLRHGPRVPNPYPYQTPMNDTHPSVNPLQTQRPGPRRTILHHLTSDLDASPRGAPSSPPPRGDHLLTLPAGPMKSCLGMASKLLSPITPSCFRVWLSARSLLVRVSGPAKAEPMHCGTSTGLEHLEPEKSAGHGGDVTRRRRRALANEAVELPRSASVADNVVGAAVGSASVEAVSGESLEASACRAALGEAASSSSS